MPSPPQLPSPEGEGLAFEEEEGSFGRAEVDLSSADFEAQAAQHPGEIDLTSRADGKTTRAVMVIAAIAMVGEESPLLPQDTQHKIGLVAACFQGPRCLASPSVNTGDNIESSSFPAHQRGIEEDLSAPEGFAKGGPLGQHPTFSLGEGDGQRFQLDGRRAAGAVEAPQQPEAFPSYRSDGEVVFLEPL